jgi:N-acetyl-alpha-D-muramate 1-phosphate uridylyltransferase
MSAPPIAMVLAAGYGQRMRPLTLTTPKPLLTVGGRALIDWHLLALARAGVRRVVINLSWLGPQIRAHVGEGGRFGLEYQYSEEGAEPLEAGGGIHRALPLLARDGDDAPFLIVNGDIWTDFDFARLSPLPAGSDALLVMVPNPPQHPRGDFALAAGRVIADQQAPRRTYAGIGLYRPSFFAGCQPGKFPLLPLLQRSLQAGRLAAQAYDGLWFDIGTPQRLAELDQRLAAGANG